MSEATDGFEVSEAFGATDRSGAMVTPGHDCPLCPRLVAFRTSNRAAHPDWFNGPVPSLGPLDARLLVLGMAPGVKGANRTGRPFSGDDSGRLLYPALLQAGFAADASLPNVGTGPWPPDLTLQGLTLQDCRIVNAVRCVPPANLPIPAEVHTCNQFLIGELRAMPELRMVLALGVLAHAAALRACGIPPSRIRFQHAAIHELPDGLLLANSYHVSRYNTDTGRLTTAMFHAVIQAIAERLA